MCGKRLSTARIQSVCEEGVARAGTVVPPSPVEGRHSVSALSASPAIPCNAMHELWYGGTSMQATAMNNSMQAPQTVAMQLTLH